MIVVLINQIQQQHFLHKIRTIMVQHKKQQELQVSYLQLIQQLVDQLIHMNIIVILIVQLQLQHQYMVEHIMLKLH